MTIEQIIPRGDGVIFGNFTQSGFAGNAAMFDGNLVNNYPNVGAYALGLSAYIGKQFSEPKAFSRALFYGWNDRGIIDDGSSGTLYIYGKNGLPTNQTDGVILGHVSFSEPSTVAYGSPLEVVSSDTMNKYTCIWAVIVAVAATGICGAELLFFENTEVVAPVGKPLAIFLGSGQSNMRGDAPVPDQAIYANHARLKMFALDGTIKAAADPMMNTQGSQWPQFSDTTGKCGTLMPFGDEIAPLLKNFDVLLVNSSKGSTSIEEWAKGQPLYDGMISRARAALAAAPVGSFIAGLVWQQGESNTLSEASAAGWGPQFITLIANIRADLEISDLPVVMIGLGPYDAFAPAWPQLRFSQQFMKLPEKAAYVKTFDLPNGASADWIITDSVLTIGKRSAQAMRPMLPRML